MNPAHWMSPADAAVGVMALFFVLIIVYGTVVVLHGRRERRQFDLDIARYEGKIEANRARSQGYAGRHAASRPLLSDAKVPDRAPGAAFESRWPRRIITTAADLAPVIHPHGAAEVPLRPQAASEPGRRTAALDKLTDTGWMRAIEGNTNENIHHMNADGEQYRREYRRKLRAQDAAPSRPDGPAPARTPAPGAGPLNRPEGRP